MVICQGIIDDCPDELLKQSVGFIRSSQPVFRSLVLLQDLLMIYSASKCFLGNTGQTEFRGSRGSLLPAAKQCQSHSQTTGERLRSQARLIDILTYCTFPGRGLPCGNTLLPYSSPLKALILSMRSRSQTRPNDS